MPDSLSADFPHESTPPPETAPGWLCAVFDGRHTVSFVLEIVDDLVNACPSVEVIDEYSLLIKHFVSNFDVSNFDDQRTSLLLQTEDGE